MSKSQITHSAAQTQELAVHFAERILDKGPSKTALVLALSGDLGAGKTTFLQGFARALGIEEVVNSPTFVVMKSFKIQDQNFKKFYHIVFGYY
jgi:tRNA threonylcarbamoyladenosine biosynthesis protein TsaE